MNSEVYPLGKAVLMLLTQLEGTALKRHVSGFYFDVDDTLLPMNGGMDSSFLPALADFRGLTQWAKDGVLPPFCLVSGRSDHYLEAASFFLGDPDLPRISESGARIRRRGERPIKNPGIVAEDERALGVMRERIPAILAACPGLYRYGGKTYGETFELSPRAQISIEGAEARIREVLSDILELNPVIMVTHSSIAVDITLVTKISGILIHADLEDLSSTRIVFAGDSGGDAAPIEFAQYAICPAKASSQIQNLVKAKGEQGIVAPDQGSCLAEVNWGIKELARRLI